MAAFRRRRVVRDFNPRTTGPNVFDLPVDPLSALIVSIAWTSPNEALRAYNVWTQALSILSRVTVTRLGVDVIDAPLRDLAVLYAIAAHWPPWTRARAYASGFSSQLTVPLCFSRQPYSADEGLPATQRGDLLLSLEVSETEAAADSVRINVEAIELPDADPAAWLRVTTVNAVPQDGEDMIFTLPNNARLLGLLLHDDNPVGPDVVTSSFGNMKLMIDNHETHYTDVTWDAMHGELLRAAPALLTLDEHVHAINNTSEAAPLSEQQTSPRSNLILLNRYAWLDLDPTRDGAYALDTSKGTAIELRARPTQTSSTPVQCLPLELVQLAGAGA